MHCSMHWSNSMRFIKLDPKSAQVRRKSLLFIYIFLYPPYYLILPLYYITPFIPGGNGKLSGGAGKPPGISSGFEKWKYYLFLRDKVPPINARTGRVNQYLAYAR